MRKRNEELNAQNKSGGSGGEEINTSPPAKEREIWPDLVRNGGGDTLRKTAGVSEIRISPPSCRLAHVIALLYSHALLATLTRRSRAPPTQR